MISLRKKEEKEKREKFFCKANFLKINTKTFLYSVAISKPNK